MYEAGVDEDDRCPDAMEAFYSRRTFSKKMQDVDTLDSLDALAFVEEDMIRFMNKATCVCNALVQGRKTYAATKACLHHALAHQLCFSACVDASSCCDS